MAADDDARSPDETTLTAELAAMAAGPTDAESVLAQLASALFPGGAPTLERLTWPDASIDGDDTAPGATSTDPGERSDAMLRTAEVRYRTLVEQIPAVTFMAVLGEGKNEVYVSPHIEAMLGFTQAEWLEDPFLWFRQLYPADREIWIQEFARGCRTGGPFSAECRFLARDGRVVWVRGEARLVKDALGRPLFLQGVAFDITESKHAQEVLVSRAIRTTEERYRDVVQGIGAIFWEADAETLRFTFVSPQAEQLLGFPAERWITEPDFWMTLVHADDRERVAGEWQAATVDGTDRDVDYRAITATGGVVWLHARVHVVRDDRGRPRYLLGFMVDVTERRRTEEERVQLLAREHEARTEAETLNQVGRQLAGELELRRLVQAITDAGTQLTGAAFGAFVERGDDEGRNTPLFEATFRGERIVRVDDLLVDRRHGRHPPYHGTPPGPAPMRSYLAVPVVLRNGEVLGGLFFGHPEPARFTERHERLLGGLAAQAAVAMDNARLYRAAEEARRAAEAANHAKDEFLATISHELRTPLTSILGWARLLRKGAVDPALTRRAIDVIERNASAQAQLIEDLLDVSRIVLGQFQLDLTAIESLGPIVANVVESFRPAADAKRISLVATADPLSGPIAGDAKRLQQVVWNLVSNAIKFTPERGAIVVTCDRLDSHVELRVTDTGRGIPADFLPRLFDRFTQADSTSTRAQGGLGLGLAIVHHLVELHGGSVHAESDGQGQGATFIVRLPVAGSVTAAAEPMRVPMRERSRAEAGMDLDAVRVLLVEDDDDTRTLITTILQGAGAVVRSSPSATAALRALEQDPPDVLVCDLGLPGADGYDLIEAVRSLPRERGGEVPAVAVTAYAAVEDRRRALHAGFQAHVAKPVDPAELVESIARTRRAQP